jgi:single-strand DNA-binding protein
VTNVAVLVGTITGDITRSLTKNNEEFCNFKLSVRRTKYKGAYNGFDMFNCMSFGSTAKFISENFRAGMHIAVVGSTHINHLTDENGYQRTVPIIQVDSVSFCGNKEDIDIGEKPIKVLDNQNHSMEDAF